MGSVVMIALRKWFVRGVCALFPSARVLRISVYATFAFGALALASARSVYADATELGLGLGHQLAKLEDLTSGAYVIHVNGAELHRASAYTSQNAGVVLDRYETYCRERPGAIGRAMSDIPAALQGRIKFPEGSAMRIGVMRSEADGRGMLVCFVDEASVPEVPLVSRMRAFAETSDLSKFGHFRYVFVEPSRADPERLRVITFWSDGELNVNSMFPSNGDAPGTDSRIAPRPAESRRTLSASVDGYPAAVRIYESRESRDALVQAYDESLRANGFTKVAPRDAARGEVAYVREDNAEIVVSIVETKRGTSVTLVEALASSTQGVHVEVK
jgi:hypothetical protein